jgi:hypothetical protein
MEREIMKNTMNAILFQVAEQSFLILPRIRLYVKHIAVYSCIIGYHRAFQKPFLFKGFQLVKVALPDFFAPVLNGIEPAQLGVEYGRCCI